jgi:8-oxo-dGTP pyrophosphatase MutT (NUDIX family)
LPLVLERQPCGWVDPDAARCLARAPSPFELDRDRLSLPPAPGEPQACSQAMRFAAQRLHEAGIVRHWRSEELDVRSEDGRAIATVERAACRALGIATRSVHLNGFRPDGSLCAARRAPHKLSDPDCWDNLAGGMVAAGEHDLQALAREAYEEAGLQLAPLQVVRGSQLPVQRMVAEGLMIESVQVFDVQLPGDFVPVNLDGEVACFDSWPVESALDAIERGDFTLEASLATLDALQRANSGRELR